MEEKLGNYLTNSVAFAQPQSVHTEVRSAAVQFGSNFAEAVACLTITMTLPPPTFDISADDLVSPDDFHSDIVRCLAIGDITQKDYYCEVSIQSQWNPLSHAERLGFKNPDVAFQARNLIEKYGLYAVRLFSHPVKTIQSEVRFDSMCPHFFLSFYLSFMIFLSFYSVMEVIFDLIRNSPNYTSFCNTTTSSIDLVVDVMIWLDACSPMTAVKLRVYDHYLMFFTDGASKPLDLLTYVGTEHNIHQVRIRNSRVPAHICASIYIYIGFCSAC